MIRLLFPIILCFIIVSCDAGLAPPPPVELGFSGTVYFTHGSWPPADSLASLLIFASTLYPLDSATVFNGLFSNSPTIFLYPDLTKSLPFFVDSVSYTFPLHSGTYKYIGVIQQVSSNLLTSGIRAFKVVGFYPDKAHPLQPGNVLVNDNAQVTGINIDVNFQNPPPQPF